MTINPLKLLAAFIAIGAAWTMIPSTSAEDKEAKFEDAHFF